MQLARNVTGFVACCAALCLAGCTSARSRYVSRMLDLQREVSRAKRAGALLPANRASALLGEPEKKLPVRNPDNLKKRVILELFDKTDFVSNVARQTLQEQCDGVVWARVSQWLYDEDLRFGEVRRRAVSLHPPDFRESLLVVIWKGRILYAEVFGSPSVDRNGAQEHELLQGF